MEAVPVGEEGITPEAEPMQTTVALDRDGTCIAEARHLTVQFLADVQAEHGPSVSARAIEVTQLVVSAASWETARRTVGRNDPPPGPPPPSIHEDLGKRAGRPPYPFAPGAYRMSGA